MKMYKNAGKSLKNVISFVAKIEMLISIVIGICIVVFFHRFDGTGLGILIAAIVVGVGCFGAWVKKLELYAFGEIADCAVIFKECISNDELPVAVNMAQSTANAAKITTEPQKEMRTWKCYSCGTDNLMGTFRCKKCNTTLGDSEHMRMKKEGK